MPSFFTHYWREEPLVDLGDDELFEHSAGNGLHKYGFSPGDVVYGVTWHKGSLIVFGRMVLAREPVSYGEALRLLAYKPWDAEDHLIGDRRTATPVSRKRVVPSKILEQLRFISPKGETRLKLDARGWVDQQTARNVCRLTPESAALLDSLFEKPISRVFEVSAQLPSRREILIRRLQRDRPLVACLKKRHDDICQRCGGAIDIPGGRRYSEAHHVKPLGGRHRGEDKLENLLCVCPNCHAMLDLGCIRIEVKALRSAKGHDVDPRNVAYHNEMIWQKPLDDRPPRN